jgi:hypothetical protein
MAMKNRGEEVTYAKLVSATPKALANKDTEAPVDKNVVYKILRKRCYDSVDDPDDTWKHNLRLSQNALTDGQKAERQTWGLGFQENDIRKKRRTANWFYHNLVWTDICNSILPRTQKRHEEMILARKGKKGWGSSKTKRQSKNLRSNTAKTKQKSWDSIKVWWAPVLTRGKLHVEMLGDDFPGEKAGGAAIAQPLGKTNLLTDFSAQGYSKKKKGRPCGKQTSLFSSLPFPFRWEEKKSYEEGKKKKKKMGPRRRRKRRVGPLRGPIFFFFFFPWSKEFFSSHRKGNGREEKREVCFPLLVFFAGFSDSYLNFTNPL